MRDGDFDHAADFSGQTFGALEAGWQDDRLGTLQDLGRIGGIDIGRMIGAAVSFGFGSRGGW